MNTSRIGNVQLIIPKKTKLDTSHINVVPHIDKWSNYPSAGLTPAKLARILRDADQGNTRDQAEMFEEMLEKDGMMDGMFGARKRTVARRSYTIIPASKDNIDQENAEFVREIFDNINDWRNARENILDAVPKGYSALQINWERFGDVIGIHSLEPTHQKHFRFGRPSDPNSSLREVRRISLDNLVDGVELEANKWVFAIMQARSGHPSRTSVMRPCTWNYLFKNFSVKAWVQFCEVYGVPLRVGKYPESAADNTKLLNDLASALRSIGMDASAMIPDTMKIEFVEAMTKAASASVHGDLKDHCNAENSVAILGHTAGAISTPGKLGNEDQALDAIFAIAESDANSLDAVVSDQIIKPLLIFNKGIQKRYPKYKTDIAPPKDITKIVEKYDGAINRLRIPVKKSDVYEELGIQEPQDGDEVIMPPTFAPQQNVPGVFSTPLRYLLSNHLPPGK